NTGGAKLFEHPGVTAFEGTELEYAAASDSAKSIDGPLEARIAKQRHGPGVAAVERRGEPGCPLALENVERLLRRGRARHGTMRRSGPRDREQCALGEASDAIKSGQHARQRYARKRYARGRYSTVMSLRLRNRRYQDLTPKERERIREGVERRALQPYLEGATSAKPMQWLTAKHNWNPVCNGGATVLALAVEGESALAPRVLALSVPAMNLYW